MAKQKLSNVQQRIKAKRKMKFKRKVKDKAYVLITILSMTGNIYFISEPYQEDIINYVVDLYYKVAPIVESLVNQLPI
jgi:hypothetical protein